MLARMHLSRKAR